MVKEIQLFCAQEKTGRDNRLKIKGENCARLIVEEGKNLSHKVLVREIMSSYLKNKRFDRASRYFEP